MRVIGLEAVALSLVLLLIGAASAPEGVLTIRIGNVRNTQGRVHVDVCRQAHFLKEDCAYSGMAPAQAGTTTVTVRGLPAGRYAVQAFHDENANGKVDRALFGLPKEGVGFSNDAKIRFGPPKFPDAAFDFSGRSETIQLNMRYFLGASGPAQAR